MHEPTMEDVQRQIAGKVLFLIGLFILFLAGAFLMTFSNQFNTTIAIGLFFVILPVVLTWGGLIVRAIMLGLAVVAFLIGLLFGYCETAGDYNLALQWMQDGKYEDARNLFDSLIGFRDCEEKIIECENYIQYEYAMEDIYSYPTLTYSRLFALKGFAPADEMLATPAMQEARKNALAVGKYVDFGRYSTESYSDSPRTVSWEIVARDGDRALLVCLWALEVRPFHDQNQLVSWADCSLRQWMNGEFFQALFTPEEQTVIEPTLISSGEVSTEDNLFLLSTSEVFHYLPDVSDRDIIATDYVKRKYDVPGYRHADWLLRPDETAQTTVPHINHEGELWPGETITTPSCIRPALWVTLDPNFF